MITAVLFLVSWALFAWGQPHISPILSVFASSFGLALMWLALLRIQSKKIRYVVSALWFFAVQLVQLSWFASPTYQGTYIYFVYGGLALWLGAEFGILSLFLPKKGPISLRRILGISALWTLLEWSRLFVLCGFAWNPVGLSLTGFNISSQLASVVGVFGLSFLVMMINLLGVNFYYRRNKRALLIYGGVLLFPYLFGAFHLDFHGKKDRKDPYHVALVQTALLPDEKDYYYGKEDRFVHPYLQWYSIVTYLKNHGDKRLDLIVLPEYALPFGSHAKVYSYSDMALFMEGELGDLSSLLVEPFAEKREGKWYVSNSFWAQAIADYHQAELVMGLDSKDGKDHYNAAFHFSSHGAREVTRYEKRVLLPLAEYLPFTFLKPLVARYGITNFFTHGKESKVMGEKHPMSLSVCYEECFPHIMREGRIKGAKLFVNVTNDGWYPYSRLPEEHYIHGRIRAIENGVPLLRACNTGITAGVDSLGRTVARLENGDGSFELKKGALFIPLDLYSYPTLYTFWGDTFIILISLVSLFFLRNPLAEKRESDLS
ncbi:MAG: apolipoprotein N-acyltransferase [Simkaniaceae bacterium]|nr:MAG: apolipoprotein N-acyltransferase [Simkaniaceae bacterium]